MSHAHKRRFTQKQRRLMNQDELMFLLRHEGTRPGLSQSFKLEVARRDAQEKLSKLSGRHTRWSAARAQEATLVSAGDETLPDVGATPFDLDAGLLELYRTKANPGAGDCLPHSLCPGVRVAWYPWKVGDAPDAHEWLRARSPLASAREGRGVYRPSFAELRHFACEGVRMREYSALVLRNILPDPHGVDAFLERLRDSKEWFNNLAIDGLAAYTGVGIVVVTKSGVAGKIRATMYPGVDADHLGRAMSEEELLEWTGATVINHNNYHFEALLRK